MAVHADRSGRNDPDTHRCQVAADHPASADVPTDGR